MSNLFNQLGINQKVQVVNNLNDQEIVDLFFDWSAWARPEQLEPTVPYDIWAIIAGRGFGKTRTGAEWTIEKARQRFTDRIALIGATASDVRDTMIEGESGILSCSHPNFRPEYTPSKRKLEWPNGVKAFTYSAEEPERLRGPQHGAGWCDEIAAWRYWETYEQYEYGLRLGSNPVTCITTTPKPRKELINLLKEKGVIVTKGSTLDNTANLPQKFINRILNKYSGTRLGQQEIFAELLEESEGALWRRSWIENHRTNESIRDVLERMVVMVVAIDPAVTSDKKSNETGIIAAGKDIYGQYYVFKDASLIDSPENWTGAAIRLAGEMQTDLIITESNNGGDLIKSTFKLHNHNCRIKKVWASRGKHTRAEPVSMLYEQGKVSHIGYLGDLEDELCTWDPKDPHAPSPNRLDALVWALTYLLKGEHTDDSIAEIHNTLKTANEFGITTGQLQGPDF